LVKIYIKIKNIIMLK